MSWPRIVPWRLAVIFALLGQASLCAETKSTLGEDFLARERENIQSGNLTAARDQLDQFEQANKPNVESLDLRGVLLMEEGKFAEAAKAFEAAHNANPPIFTPRLHAGDLLLRQKKFQEARDAYETLLKETKISLLSERLRFAMLITHLGERDDIGARSALERIAFPTQTPAYYYAQAAWSFAHGKNAEGEKWIKGVSKIFPPQAESWFARPLYELGWIKEKPAVATT